MRARLETPQGSMTRAGAGLTRFFGKADPADDQRRAAERAVKANFSVITGGPGTGKTRTVVVLLALLLEQFSARGQTARIALAAPRARLGHGSRSRSAPPAMRLDCRSHS
jgi:exodeoxyribonuclease V alpha subunit